MLPRRFFADPVMSAVARGRGTFDGEGGATLEPSEHERRPLRSLTEPAMTSSAVMPIKSSKFKDQAVIFVKMKKAELRMKHLIRQRDSIQMKTPEEQGILIPEDAEGGRRDNLSALMQIVVFDPISIMLVFWPIGWASSLLEWADAITFATNFLAMIPLAKILGDATEELAAGLKNDTVGGLLNATFGNAVEMILTVQMLRENKIEVVKGTLLGSILSNLLLVLGMSFFAGGLTQRDGTRMNKEQTFSPGAALTNMTMLLIATCAFALPTVFFSAPASGRRGARQAARAHGIEMV